MENIFFESTSSSGHGLYFVPGWTGRERVYALPRPQRAPVSERQAFAVDGRRILHATLSRADGTARLTVSTWRGGDVYWVEFPCSPGARFLQLSASAIARGLRLLLLEERESGLVLHLAEGTAHQTFPCALRRQSPRDVFTAGVAPESGLAYLARRCEDRLDVERFKLPLGPARSCPYRCVNGEEGRAGKREAPRRNQPRRSPPGRGAEEFPPWTIPSLPCPRTRRCAPTCAPSSWEPSA